MKCSGVLSGGASARCALCFHVRRTDRASLLGRDVPQARSVPRELARSLAAASATAMKLPQAGSG